MPTPFSSPACGGSTRAQRGGRGRAASTAWAASPPAWASPRLSSPAKRGTRRGYSAAMRRSPSVLTSALAYLVLRYGDITSLYAIVHARVHGLHQDLLEEALYPLRKEAA